MSAQLDVFDLPPVVTRDELLGELPREWTWTGKIGDINADARVPYDLPEQERDRRWREAREADRRACARLRELLDAGVLEEATELRLHQRDGSDRVLYIPCGADLSVYTRRQSMELGYGGCRVVRLRRERAA